MRRTRLISLLLAASVLSLLCTSCMLINYSFMPPDTITSASPIANNSVISFDFYHYRSREDELAFAGSIKEGLVGASAFHNAVLVSDTETPNTGPHVSVRMNLHTTKASPSWKSFHLFLSLLTLNIIPYYGEPAGSGPNWAIYSIAVTYELYADGASKKIYPYTINMKVFSWILAPLAIPFLSSDREIRNALTATARQFLRDAKRDGFL
jgi:hypothetical protein